MFEKLKEYWLYIILWLIALWALAYAYVQTSNSQKWAEIHEANLDAMVTNLAKSDKLKKNSTVADNLLNANWWKTIWKYKIDSSKISYVIWETYEDIFENKQMLDISADVADVEDWQLRTVLIAKPAVQVNWNDINTVNLNSDKSLTIWNNTISKDDLKDVADELKWYNISAIWYTSFDTEQEAKDFRDTYFSNYEVYEIWTTWKYIVLTEYNDWWSNNVNDKVDTQTREDLLALNNWTWNSEPSTPTEPTWPTEEELLQQQVNTIKNNLTDEVTDLQTYLASQWLNSTNNTTINDMINQVIAKINWINWTNKDEKNTEIQNDINNIQALINSLKSEELSVEQAALEEQHNQEVTNAKNLLTTKKNEAVTLLNNTNLSNSNKSSAQNRINTVTTNINNLTYETLNTVSSIETEINSIKDFINNAVVCEWYQEFSNWACQTAIYLDSNWVTMKATNYAVAWKEYTLSWKTYYVAKNWTKLNNWYYVWCYDVKQKIDNWYQANRIITSKCTDFSFLFNENTTFNQNISNWDASNVTSMRMMFSSANSFNQPIWIWDVSHVTDMVQMFRNWRTWSNMTFSQDLSNWNTSNVTNMYTMFYHYNPTLLQNMNISGWNVSKVTNCEHFLNRHTWKPNYFPNFTNCTPWD